MKAIGPALALTTASVVAGCVPYPVYNTLQPAAEMTVLDENSRPIAGAKVVLMTGFNPYGSETAETKSTNEQGKAVFEMRSEWQQESLMFHGAKYYYWNWCVRKASFATYTTGGRSGNTFDPNTTIRLSQGPSAECPAMPHS